MTEFRGHDELARLCGLTEEEIKIVEEAKVNQRSLNDCLRKCFQWVRDYVVLLLLVSISSVFIVFSITQFNEAALSAYNYTNFLADLLLSILTIFVVINFFKLTVIHGIYRDASFVSFTYVVAIIVPIIICAYDYISYLSNGYGIYRHWEVSLKWTLIVVLGVVSLYVCTLLISRFIIRPLEGLKLRFAADAVGKDRDMLGISHSARNYALGIRDTSAYVSVYGLYGGMGQGKSSFGRMTVEWLMDEEISGANRPLYTYISLTETNEARDFSKLFAERWSQTLSERYPRINMPNFSSTLRSIFRDSDSGLVASVLSFLDYFNVPLFRMAVKQWDSSVCDDQKHVTHEMGMLFGFIPHVHEDLWVIMVDEVERAALDEIYRLVEIIERFKSEGRTGVPVKIAFVLCIANDELGRYLDSFKMQDMRAHLLKDFFIDDPKNITQTIFLPPPSSEAKMNLIIQKLKGVFDQFGVLQNVRWENGSSIEFIVPSRGFTDEEKALQYAVAFVATKSPRTVMRCIFEMESFYRCFRDLHFERKPDTIRACDILMLSYLRFTHPEVIEFLRSTVNELLPGADVSRRMLDRIMRDENKEYTLGNWIKDTVDWDVREKEGEIKEIFNLCAKAWVNQLEKNPHVEPYERSTSDPQLMNDYLVSIDAETDMYRWAKAAYKAHKRGDLKVVQGEASIDNVIMYARTVHTYTGVEANILKDIMNIIYQWLVGGNIKVQKCDLGNTYYDEYITFFAFYITDFIERLPDDNDRADALDQIWELINGVLVSASVPLGAKYRLMSDFIHQRTGDIHFKMVMAFKMIIQRKGEPVALQGMQAVFDQRDREYYDGDKVLYEQEENFIYTLYQGWSGDVTDVDEIENIRKVAARNLEQYPKAIELYWDQYPSGKKSKIFNRMNSWHKKGNELYMPLGILIDITNRAADIADGTLEKMRVWEEILQDDGDRERYEKLSSIKDDPNTLYGVYLRSKAEYELKESESKAGD